MSQDSKSFCVLPWVHMSLNPDGRATLCCKSHHQIQDDQGQSLNVQTHSLSEIWNSSGMRDIRRRMAAGEELPHCRACFDSERFGTESYRTRSNREWLTDAPTAKMTEQTITNSADGFMPESPLYFDLRLGNTCNLKCTACKPLYSSQIERDPVHSKWNTDAPYHRLSNRFKTEGEWHDAPALLNEIISMSGNLAVLQLAGGEPTINRTQIAFLDNLCKTGQAASIDLQLVTNLINVRPAVYEMLNQFRSLRITLSIDGTGPTYEYVRFPGKWASLTSNVVRLRSTNPNAAIVINAVLQAVNAHNIVDLYEWADSENLSIGLSIGRGLDHYNDIRLLPTEFRNRIAADLRVFFDRKTNRAISQHRDQVFRCFRSWPKPILPMRYAESAFLN